MSRLARNAGWMGATQAVNRVIGLTITILVARLLSPGDYGLYAMAMAGGALVAAAADFGVDAVLLRELSSKPENRRTVLAAGFMIKASLSALGILGLVAYAYWVGPVPTFPALALALGASVAFRHSATALWMPNRADERMGSEAASTILAELVLLSAVCVALVQRHGLVGLGLAYLASGLTAVLIAAAAFRSAGRSFASPSRELAKSLVRDASVFGGAMFAAALYGRVAGTLILGSLRGPEAAGAYDIGFKAIPLLLVLPAAFGTAALPAMSRSLSANRSKLAHLCQGLMSPLLAFAGAALAGGWLIGPRLLTVILGPEYQSSGPLLRIFLLAVPAASIKIVFFNALLASEKQVVILRSVFCVGVIALPAHVVAIHFFGATGAAWITVGAEWIIMGLAWAAVSKLIAPISLTNAASLGALSAGAVGIAAWATKGFVAVVPLFLGLAVYLGLFLTVPGFRPR